MESEENKATGDTKWNSHQEPNEGFSAQNIPQDYNPSDEKIENRLRPELETRQDGSHGVVERARFPDDAPQEDTASPELGNDNRVIENQESLENRDRNYDLDPERYPPSHPENKENRGNLDL